MAYESDQELSLPSILGVSTEITRMDSLLDDIGSSTLGGLALQPLTTRRLRGPSIVAI